MRVSRFTDAQLEQMAGRYRSNASESNQEAWPKNADHYRRTQLDMAEIIEELLERRNENGVAS